MMNPMLKSTIVLTLVCVVAAALLGGTYMLTEEKIEQQKQEQLQKNLNQVFPEADDFTEKEDYYVAKKQGNIIGYATIAESQGYSSVMQILVGMDLEKKITGIRIIFQEETPGLGAKATEPDFYNQFEGLKKGQVVLSGDDGKIDAITGATITSDAVIEGVKNAAIQRLIPLIGSEMMNNTGAE